MFRDPISIKQIMLFTNKPADRIQEVVQQISPVIHFEKELVTGVNPYFFRCAHYWHPREDRMASADCLRSGEKKPRNVADSAEEICLSSSPKQSTQYGLPFNLARTKPFSLREYSSRQSRLTQAQRFGSLSMKNFRSAKPNNVSLSFVAYTKKNND